MFQPRVLLHPTDYSDCARYAFDVAVDLARHHGARLIVVHVADTLGPETVSIGEAVSERQPVGHRRRLEEELQKLVPSSISGFTIQHVLTEGDPATAIAQTALEHSCDLIVMGTYGRSALSRLLMGSVTQKVSHLVSCAVLTVRMPSATAPVG